MAKQQGRKPPKRKPRVENEAVTADSDLIALAMMIDEYKLDKNAQGWFALPWRNGFNAAGLGIAVWQRAVSQTPRPEINAWLRVVPRILIRDRSSQTYEDIEEVLHGGHHHSGFAPIRVAFRCAQLAIARSDGGGHIYNDLLKNLVEHVDILEDEVIRYRCMDATGVSPGFLGDINDPLRRAFVIAWRRGLYHAAYALPQAKDFY